MDDLEGVKWKNDFKMKDDGECNKILLQVYWALVFIIAAGSKDSIPTPACLD